MLAKGFKPAGYAQKDESKVRQIPDLMKNFSDAANKFTTDKDF